VVLAIALAVAAPAGAQQTPAPIRYTVRFPAPQTNYVEVEGLFPTGGRASLDLLMAVWTPGSYLVREYERNVEALTASAGGPTLPVDKTVKNRWRVTTNGARDITVRYRVYSHEMSVRNNWVDSDFAMLNGAQTFLTIASDVAGPATPAYSWTTPRVARPHDVTIVLPAGWKTTISGLAAAPDGAPNHYLAPDFDTLVDCPIVAGNPAIHEFTVGGKPHYLVDVGEDGVFDGARAARDLQRVVEYDRAFWGDLPYDKYVFFNVLTGGGGGIEHKNSVMMMASRWATTTRERYVGWLGTASHEFFHLWNVKRLRPIELGPFDYERENYPRSLWVSEGFTDYYADVILARTGLITEDEYLRQLSSAIRMLQTTPGRLVQTAEMASFDAWIKQYRPDENSANTSISYYTKGAVIGFLLDARIRSATNGAKSLDDLMRLAFQRYSGARGFTPQDFRRTASEVAGTDLGPWFEKVLDTTEELDYQPALDWFGLAFEAPTDRQSSSGWLGAVTRDEDGLLIVTSVRRGTPAYEAGINAGDEILAIDNLRVTPADYERRLDTFRPGAKVSVLVARRDELKRLDATLAAEPENRWNLTVPSGASAPQQGYLHAWIGGAPAAGRH
jgi:predicted metalloprotease with PDZ domain